MSETRRASNSAHLFPIYPLINALLLSVHYVEALEGYLEKYANTNKTRTCTGSASNSDIVENGKVKNSGSSLEACRFSLSAFKEKGCSKVSGG